MDTTDPLLDRWRIEQKRWQVQVDRYERQLEHAKQRLGRIGIAIEEYVALEPEAAIPEAGENKALKGTGTTVDQIVEILDAVSPRSYTDEDVLTALRARGWTTSSEDAVGLVRTYLSRLYRSDRIRRPSKGRYAALSQNADGPTEVGPSRHLALLQEGGGGDASVAE